MDRSTSMLIHSLQSGSKIRNRDDACVRVGYLQGFPEIADPKSERLRHLHQPSSTHRCKARARRIVCFMLWTIICRSSVRRAREYPL